MMPLGGNSKAARRAMILRSGQRRRYQTRAGNPELAGVGGAVLGRQGLHVLDRFGHHHAIDQNPGNLDLPRRQPAALGDALDLGDHDAVAVLGRHRHGEIVEGEGFALHRDVAEGIRRGAPHEGDVDLADLVEQPLLTIDFDQTDDVPGGGGIDPATAVAGIDEGVESDLGEGTGFAGGQIPEQLADDSLRQVIGLDAVVECQLRHLRHAAPVARHHPAQQAFVAQVIEPQGLAVALAGGGEQRQVLWAAGGEEAALQRRQQGLGEAGLDEPGTGQRIAIPDQGDRFVGGNDLAAHGAFLPIIFLISGPRPEGPAQTQDRARAPLSANGA
jgi:hypothetical protein